MGVTEESECRSRWRESKETHEMAAGTQTIHTCILWLIVQSGRRWVLELDALSSTPLPKRITPNQCLKVQLLSGPLFWVVPDPTLHVHLVVLCLFPE